MKNIIIPLRGSFNPGKGTTDNVIVAQEVIYYMHHSKAENGVVAFNIDLEKAYDRLRWDFLERVL